MPTFRHPASWGRGPRAVCSSSPECNPQFGGRHHCTPEPCPARRGDIGPCERVGECRERGQAWRAQRPQQLGLGSERLGVFRREGVWHACLGKVGISAAVEAEAPGDQAPRGWKSQDLKPEPPRNPLPRGCPAQMPRARWQPSLEEPQHWALADRPGMPAARDSGRAGEAGFVLHRHPCSCRFPAPTHSGPTGCPCPQEPEGGGLVKKGCPLCPG